VVNKILPLRYAPVRMTKINISCFYLCSSAFIRGLLLLKFWLSAQGR